MLRENNHRHNSLDLEQLQYANLSGDLGRGIQLMSDPTLDLIPEEEGSATQRKKDRNLTAQKQHTFKSNNTNRTLQTHQTRIKDNHSTANKIQYQGRKIEISRDEFQQSDVSLSMDYTDNEPKSNLDRQNYEGGEPESSACEEIKSSEKLSNSENKEELKEDQDADDD